MKNNLKLKMNAEGSANLAEQIKSQEDRKAIKGNMSDEIEKFKKT